MVTDRRSFSSLTLSARLLDQLLDITQAVSGPEDPDQVPIDKLIRLVDLEASLSKEEKTLYEDFVQATENYLGIKSQPLNLTQLWEKKSPPTSQGRSLPESVNKVGYVPALKEALLTHNRRAYYRSR